MTNVIEPRCVSVVRELVLTVNGNEVCRKAVELGVQPVN